MMSKMNSTRDCMFSQTQNSIDELIPGRSAHSDYELAEAIAHETFSTVGDLYKQHRRTVYALCLRLTGNAAEAEDLTQEVFIQLLRKAGTFRGESQFTTWLYRVTTNQVLMHFRRTTRRAEKLPQFFNEFRKTHVGKYSGGSQLMDRIALNAALAKLPSGSRSIFLKFDVEGYNHEEIAEIFGCTVGTSKSQLHKARKKLRKLLKLEKRPAVPITVCAHPTSG
jgi:RNA polymerase sigma-70 factor, ECF subfamily